MNAPKWLHEFKSFAFKGNMIDLAVGVVIGAAFGRVIDSLVKKIFMPLVSLIIPTDAAYQRWTWTIGEKEVEFGAFLGELVSFTIVAAVVFFFVVKLMGAVRKIIPAESGEPTTKECEYCLSVIPAKARKCAHCTADLPAPATK